MRFVLVAGTTRTAAIDGISAAGADAAARVHTPSADAELLEYGRPIYAPFVPVSPTGCPTPALVTRAVRDLVGFDSLVVDAGLTKPTAAPTVDVDATPGEDVREPVAVENVESTFEAARTLGATLPDDELVVGESIPGGTTTALGVLTALGEPFGVSSSLPENPVRLKEAVVADGLAASGIEPGGSAGAPLDALRAVGDPVLVAVAGLATGTLERDARVVLAGGTQMVAAAAVVRHLGVSAPFGLATTVFVAEDESTDVQNAAASLDLDLDVGDPGFDESDHLAIERYERGEAKEGVGMGGALLLADRAGVSMAAVRERIVERYDALVVDDGP